MSDLVIVESPTKAKTLERILGSQINVLATEGHILEIDKTRLTKEQREAGWPVKGVDENFDPKWAPIYGKGETIAKLQKEARKSDTVYLASDPDREGEGIAYHIELMLLEKGIPKDSIKRVSFHEITKDAVLNAMQNPTEINMDLVEAYIARSVLDILVGFTVSGPLNSYTRIKKSTWALSGGRVQSPTLLLVQDREDERSIFTPDEFWDIEASFISEDLKQYTGSLFKLPNISEKDFKINNENEVKVIEEKLKGLEYSIESKKITKTTSKPPPPYTTSTLLQNASNSFSWAAEKTNRTAQELFRGVGNQDGLITYMRTDSPNLSEEAMTEIKNHIKNSPKYGDQYFERRVYKARTANAQEAHEAIRPTSISRTPESIKNSLSDDQYKLYEMIWRRAVASQMKDSINEKITIITSSSSGEDGYKFKSQSNKLIFPGHKILNGLGKEEFSEIPNLNESQDVNLEDLEKQQKFTKPTPRFTTASLIKKMEDIGIGRPSTYASTIKRITDKEYVYGTRPIHGSNLGWIIAYGLKDYFSESFMNYEFTKKMEDDLDLISNGQLNRKSFTKDFYDNYHPKLEKFKEYASKEDWNPREYFSGKGKPYTQVTNILCSRETPAFNQLTGKAFEENDEAIQPGIENNNQNNFILRLGRRGHFLTCSNEKCPIMGSKEAWTTKGRRRYNALNRLINGRPKTEAGKEILGIMSEEHQCCY